MPELVPLVRLAVGIVDAAPVFAVTPTLALLEPLLPNNTSATERESGMLRIASTLVTRRIESCTFALC